MNELKKKRKAVEVEAKSLNKANEILSKELKISKFEFSEIEKRYNQGKIQNLNDIISVILYFVHANIKLSARHFSVFEW